MTTATIDLLVHPFYGMGLVPPYYDSVEKAYETVQGLATSPLLRAVDVLSRPSIEKMAVLLKRSEDASEEYCGMLELLWQKRIKSIAKQEHTYMGFLFSEPHKRVTPHQEALARFAQTELGDRLVIGAYGDAEVHNRLAQRVQGYNEAVIYAFGEVSDRCVRTEGLILFEKLTEAGVKNEARCHPVLCADLRDGKEQALAMYRTIQTQGAQQ